jgi:undecaprenyl-diphosphatase
VKIGPLLFAAALAAFLVLRRRRLEPTLKIGGALAVAGLLVYGSGVVHLPDVKQLVEDAGTKLGQWTYLVVGLAAFFETGAFVGLIAPGETFLIFGGVVAGQGTISLVTLIAIVWACAVAGDLVSFYAGRRLGRQFLVRHGPKVSITEERLGQVEAFFARHGGKAILLGRFVGLVRAVNPFLAGSSGLSLRRFLPYDIVGAGAWSSLLLVLGFVFWRSFDKVLAYAERGTLALGTTIVAVVAGVWVWRRLNDAEKRRAAAVWIDALLDRPALRPLGRVLRPAWRHVRRPLRFVWNRLTPGELGLELTTLLAVAAVGAFVFVGDVIMLRDHTLIAGDSMAQDLAQDLRSDTLTSIAKALTHLGSTAVVAPLVALTALLLLWRRRMAEAAAIALGATLTWVVVNVTKPLVDRPRPSGGLVAVDGESFPSGHAAYAVAWVAVAVVLTRTTPGIGRTTAIVTVAVVLTTLIGLTRVYLQVHYLSDVVGGAGLAAALYALSGMGTLVVAHVRHNGARA